LEHEAHLEQLRRSTVLLDGRAAFFAPPT